MALLGPDTGGTPLGGPAGASVAAPVAATATEGPPKRYDYRQRGLDLGAAGVAEAPARPVARRQPPRRRRRRLAIEAVVIVALTALVTVALRTSAVSPYSVTTPSMVPNLQEGSRVLVVKTALLPRPLRTGDIVVFRHPAGAACAAGGGRAEDLVKRVIATPGQRIWSAGDTIYVDGRILDEPGWYNPPYGHVGATPVRPTTVPAGDYYVMGDNRTDTCDSRAFGPIQGSLIVGRVVATVMRGGHPYFHLF